MHQIYVILNAKEPEWVYVGTSVNAYHRFIKHCSKSSKCRRLKSAIKRDGRENFQMIIVREFAMDEGDKAYEFEAYLISRLKEDGHKLYNMTGGGKGAPGRTVRKKTRLKLSETMKAKYLQTLTDAIV